MKQTHTLFSKVIFVLIVCLGLALGHTESVQAEACVWEGDGSTDWMLAGNWSCGHVPTGTDDVEILSGTLHQPTIYQMASVTVNTITINTGATLTILNGSVANAATWTIDGTLIANTGDSVVYINYNSGTGSGVINVGSTGSITKLGTGDLYIYSTFNNAGSLIFTEHGTSNDGVIIIRGGSHSGIFQGEWLYLGDNVSGQVFNFNVGSEIRVNNMLVRNGTVNIYGTYSQPANTGTSLSVQPSSGTAVVYIRSGAGILKMPEYFFIENGGKLILESQAYNYNLAKVNLQYNGELQNYDNLTITTQFDWLAGKLTGNGTTTVDTTSTFTLGTSAYTQNDFTLDSQTLVNNTTANWNKRDLTLANSAQFVNNGTFNANATTTMTGGATESFVNNGYFFKKTAGTTTTMNVPFTNNGTVETVSGTLVLQQGIDNGEDAVIDLGGGTLDPGDTLILEVGGSLIGSGTLAANLVNSGTVSPGNSAGIITVEGDYTQQAEGTLEIELGGTTPGTGHDQLVVTGTATMNGTLNVTLLPGYTPQAGDTFFIIDHPYSGTGTFDTVNLPTLPDGLELEIDFADPGVTLRVVSPGSSIFLPMIVK